MANDWVDVPAASHAAATPAGGNWVDVPHAAANHAGGLADRGSFPFDQPNTTYGTVVPLAKNNKTGAISPAFPEIIRAPVRGMVTGGERLLGLHPEEYGKAATPDETAAVTLFASPTSSMLRTDAVKAAAPVDGELTKPETAAIKKLASRIKRGESGGGGDVSDIYDKLIAARAKGKPMTVADVGNRSVQKLAGSVARAPDATADYVDQSFLGRLAGAAHRLTQDVGHYISGGPTMRQSVTQLSADQKTAAAPLYAEAFQPGSVAPLEKQFESSFTDLSKHAKEATDQLAAAKSRLTTAAAKVARAGNDVYSASAALREERQAQQEVVAAQRAVEQTRATRDAMLGRLREAQEAASNGERGGVWSPRIQQFLQDPILQAGLRRGLEIQRLEALAENRPFNPRDYAVIGQDQEGNPIIGKVPNMRLLDAGKRGLDAILEDYRNDVTGKLDLDERGRAIEAVRKAYVSELDQLNPTYSAARAAWAGPAQSKGAVKAGRAIFSRHPEDIRKYYNGLSDSDKQFFKLGVADALRDAIAKKGITAPEIRSLGRGSYDSMMKDRIRPLFSSEADYDKFLDAVTAERAIFENKNRLLGNSPTAERLADDEDARQAEAAAHGLRVVGHAASGNIASALFGVLKMRRDLGLRNDPDMNMALAKLLFDPNLDLTSGPGLALLKQASHAPQAAPPTVGDILHDLGSPIAAQAPKIGYLLPGLAAGNTGVEQ